MRKIKFSSGVLFSLFFFAIMQKGIGQNIKVPETYPLNGIANEKTGVYALVHATLFQTADHLIKDATLIIRNDKIESVGSHLPLPAEAIVIDCSGKFIYPSFIDLYSSYGLVEEQSTKEKVHSFLHPQQIESTQKGALGWNEAIRSQVDAVRLFQGQAEEAQRLRSFGIGSVLSHNRDGIFRGTGVFTTLAEVKSNLAIIKSKASTHFSFDKGSSSQAYPSSIMGSIALIRQTLIDADWYEKNPANEGANLSLKALIGNKELPRFFESTDKWNSLRAIRIGKEFHFPFIIKAAGDEYQRLEEMKTSGATFILPLNFPDFSSVKDPEFLNNLPLSTLKNWELAPSEPAAFSKACIVFALTTDGIQNAEVFFRNLRTAIHYGLPEAVALQALTKTPAQLLGIYEKVGSLEKGKLANFLITSGAIFDDNTVILENWVQGQPYSVHDENWIPIAGTYKLEGIGKEIKLEISQSGNALLLSNNDTFRTNFGYSASFVRLSYQDKEGGLYTFSGIRYPDYWQGQGTTPDGSSFAWKALRTETSAFQSGVKKNHPVSLGALTYPLGGYGWSKLPTEETILIKNATVWTNEPDGILKNTDVLIKNGKIAAIGKNLSQAGAHEIDGTGKHLTAGIIDEHSHIATSSINEGGQSVTSEVRIGDNLNPDDINIYRQLAGGVTTVQVLHGSANTIGGQCQVIKLRWGHDDEELKMASAPPTIKFALGENVKRTRVENNDRFPNTRIGVEAVLSVAFQRALDYRTQLHGPDSSKVRRDLELDALVEILNGKRYITCHSYGQQEILSAMKVSERYGYHYNTFTHVLEGYKIADELKKYKVNVSTFSDWWAYKQETRDAIAYNAAILHDEGLNVCINSDYPEQARRLNQEAAKTIRYGGVNEEEALKMVTLNPAKALHIDDQVGSIKIGKQADLVLWTDNPLSVYAKAETTIIDGTIYYDIKTDEERRQYIKKEKERLITKILAGASFSKVPEGYEKKSRSN